MMSVNWLLFPSSDIVCQINQVKHFKWVATKELIRFCPKGIVAWCAAWCRGAGGAKVFSEFSELLF